MSKIIHIHLKGKTEPAIFPGDKTAVVDGWLVITNESGEEVGKFNVAEIQGVVYPRDIILIFLYHNIRRFRMKRLPTLLLVVAFCGAAQAQETPVSEARGPNSLTRVALVTPREFTPSNLERHFREILKKNSRNATLLHFYLYPDLRSAVRNCKCRTDVNYLSWQGAFIELRTQVPPVAELISINGSAVMRIRDANGRITRKVLLGEDPMILQTSGCTGEMLHLQTTSKAAAGSGVNGGIVFFVRTLDPLNKGCAQTFTRELATRVKIDHLAVTLRSDAWFINEEEFPIIYSFEQVGVPPSRETYEASRQTSCFFDAGKIQC